MAIIKKVLFWIAYIITLIVGLLFTGIGKIAKWIAKITVQVASALIKWYGNEEFAKMFNEAMDDAIAYDCSSENEFLADMKIES